MALLDLDEIEALATKCLVEAGASEANAAAIAKTVRNADRDGATSHGIFRLPGYIDAFSKGLIRGDSDPVAIREAPALIRVDAQHGAAPLAQERACELLFEAARDCGIAMAAINDTYHFSALWPEAEAIAEAGLVGLAVTAALPYVAPAGGTSALFGTNPMAFAWPRPDGGVMCFDQAASASARGEVMIAARDGKPVPEGHGLDAQGQPTTDPSAILEGGVQLPFGGYKGSAIAMMIELMAGPMIGDRTSMQARAEQGEAAAMPLGGEVLIAIDPQKAAMGRDWQAGAEALFGQIERQGGRLPGARRHANRAKPGPRDIPQAVLDAVETARSR